MQRLFLRLHRLRAGSACAIAGHKVPFGRSGLVLCNKGRWTVATSDKLSCGVSIVCGIFSMLGNFRIGEGRWRPEGLRPFRSTRAPLSMAHRPRSDPSYWSIGHPCA